MGSLQRSQTPQLDLEEGKGVEWEGNRRGNVKEREVEKGGKRKAKGREGEGKGKGEGRESEGEWGVDKEGREREIFRPLP